MVDTNKDYSLLLIGRGIVGVAQLYDIIRNIDVSKIADGTKIQIHSLDPKPHEELGGPAYSIGGPINKYPYVTTNTLPDKTDATEEKLLKGFLNDLYTTKEGRELREIHSAVDWKGIKTKLDNNEEVYLPRILIGEFGRTLWNKAEKLATSSGGKIELHEHVGLATELAEHSIGTNGRETFKVKYKDDNGAEHIIEANTLYDAGRRAKRIPIKDSNGNEIISDKVIQNPLEKFNIDENTFAKAKEKGEELTFVLKGFGNTGMDFFSVLNDLAKRYDVKTNIIALQRHNEGLVKHPIEKADPSYIKELEGKFKSASTAEELWNAYSTEISKTKYKPGELITQDGLPHLRVGETSNRPQHVADALRGVINNVVKEFDIENQEKWYANYNRLYLKDRNRVTYALGANIEDAQTIGRLTIATGEIKQVAADGDNLSISISLKNGSDLNLKGNNVHLINAVAPKIELDDEFSVSLFNKGIAKRSKVDGYETEKDSVKPVTNSNNFFIAANILFCRPEHTGLSNIAPALKDVREAVSARIDEHLSQQAEIGKGNRTVSLQQLDGIKLNIPTPLIEQLNSHQAAATHLIGALSK
jgi:hypothetical protein